MERFEKIPLIEGITHPHDSWKLIKDAESELSKGFPDSLRPAITLMYYGRGITGVEGLVFVGRKDGAFKPKKDGSYLWYKLDQSDIVVTKNKFGISPCPTICD